MNKKEATLIFLLILIISIITVIILLLTNVINITGKVVSSDGITGNVISESSEPDFVVQGLRLNRGRGVREGYPVRFEAIVKNIGSFISRSAT